MERDHTGIVPPQYTGVEFLVEASKEFRDEQEAKLFFSIAKDRLMEVNNWHNIARGFTARFQVTDETGRESNRKVQRGDFLQVDIPGPGGKEGHGFDWVKVEEVNEVLADNLQSIAFRVRPSENPRGDGQNIAHFYDSTSTSNFIVTREGKKVTASIIDKNLKPNLGTDSFADKVRGALLGTSALAVLSKIQWQNLVDGLMKV